DYVFPSFKRSVYNNLFTHLEIINYAIGFCGEYYPCINLKYKKNESFCFNIQDVCSFIEQNYDSKHVEGFNLPKKQRYRWTRNYNWPWDIDRHSFEVYFEKIKDKGEIYQNKAKKMCEENQSPIFIGMNTDCHAGSSSPKTITYNDKLGKVHFFKVFDSYHTFQEIAMWLSNQATPLKPIPKIKDEVMSEIKGFDKFSFRKDKGKKKSNTL
ncbi:MAG: hypothetical protein ACRDFB_00720, partial [Rhabdochlamydiaceae bacterium]